MAMLIIEFKLDDFSYRCHSYFLFIILLVQLEQSQGFCDPNPTEYADAKEKEPNVVFYWGLQNDKDIITDNIQLIERNFIDRFCVGSPGKIKLSIVLASDLPDNVI